MVEKPPGPTILEKSKHVSRLRRYQGIIVLEPLLFDMPISKL